MKKATIKALMHPSSMASFVAPVKQAKLQGCFVVVDVGITVVP